MVEEQKQNNNRLSHIEAIKYTKANIVKQKKINILQKYRNMEKTDYTKEHGTYSFKNQILKTALKLKIKYRISQQNETHEV